MAEPSEAGGGIQSSPGGISVNSQTLAQYSNHEDWVRVTTAEMMKAGFPQERIARFIKDADFQHDLMRVVLEHEDAFDLLPEGSGVEKMGPIRGNSDHLYLYSFDATTGCIRRLGVNATATAIQRHLGRPISGEESMLLVLAYREGGKLALVSCATSSRRGGRLRTVSPSGSRSWTGRPRPPGVGEGGGREVPRGLLGHRYGACDPGWHRRAPYPSSQGSNNP